MAGERSEEFIDLYDVVVRIWDRKFWILLAVFVGMAAGALYGMLASPVYTSTAVISSNAPRSVLNEVVGATLPLAGGGASLLEIRLKSRSISEKVVALEPGVLATLFPKKWDEKTRKWKDGKAPSYEVAGARLRNKHLEVTSNARSGVVDVKVTLPDSTYTKRIGDAYLRALKMSIQENTSKELEDGREFLENQALTVTDPLVLATIREMLARNFQRATFNNPADFQVIEYPSFPTGKSGPQFTRNVVVFGFLSGAVMTLLLFMQYMLTAMVTERRIRKG